MEKKCAIDNCRILICLIALLLIPSVCLCYSMSFPGLASTSMGSEYHDIGHFNVYGDDYYWRHGESVLGYSNFESTFTIPYELDLNNDGVVSVYANEIRNIFVMNRVSNCTLSYDLQGFVNSDRLGWSVLDISNGGGWSANVKGPTLIKLIVGRTYALTGYFDLFQDPIPTVIDPTKQADYFYNIYGSSVLEFTNAETPEPSTLFLCALGVAVVCAFKRKFST